MENGLVTADGTNILTVEEYDRFVNAIPEPMKSIFEINTITGLRYIELQSLYEKNPQWLILWLCPWSLSSPHEST
jgi:hypothetical protein